jgi:hypothetical protein
VQEAAPENIAREAGCGVSWNFSKIPVSPPDQLNRLGRPSPVNMPPLSGVVQRKLVVGLVDHPLEREADHVADQVMQMPDPEVSATVTPLQISRECETGEKGQQAVDKGLGAALIADSAAPAMVHDALRSPGVPLDTASRRFFEARFGQDFSRVRLHTEGAAATSARAVQALAYTVGEHIVFGAGHTPGVAGSRRLLAHELAHVVQQGRAAAPRTLAPTGSPLVRRQGAPPTPAPAPPFSPLQPGPPPPSPQAPPRSTRRLKFFHGTAWSVARRISRIEPRGRGDFGAGFYTHHNPGNDDTARKAAVKWGRRVARSARPPDAYAGVLIFAAQESDYLDLRAGGRGMDYQLTRLDQPDYAKRQWKWLNDIRNTGREWNAEYRERGKRGEWVHPVRPNPPETAYNLTSGPFYRPAPGTPGEAPKPEEFTPFAVGQSLPQQVVWDNRGIELLNDSSRVTRELQAYDATGDNDQPVTPPANLAAEPVEVDSTAPPLPEDYL